MNNNSTLTLKRLGIDTYKDSIIYMRHDCTVCAAEGFQAPARVRVTSGDRSIIATLNMITSNLLDLEEVGLSDFAWKLS